jgi:hypothetical protein
VIYVVNVLRIKGQTRDNHVMRMREHPMWDAPICWPADGQQAHGNETIAGFYKKAGLNMQPTWTTFPQGGYALDARIAAMRDRFSKGKLLFPEWERELLDEYQGYHYDQNGKVVAMNDDILSAVMQAVMGIRHARTMSADASGNFHRRQSYANLNSDQAIAARCNYDMFNPTGV